MIRALTAVALLLLGACAAEGRAPAAEVAWLDGAQRAHGRADEAMAQEDWEGARAALTDALAAPPPPGLAAADARVVRQDLLFRLSEAELRAGHAAVAADRADEGLNLGRAADVFTANLLVARGRAREALGRSREAAGDYFDALEINDTLLDQALDGTGAQ